MIDDILVSWMIPTFDRQLKGPFPLPHRHYILDWTKTNESEQAEIIKILEISNDSSSQKSCGIGTHSETFSVGASKPDERMLRFRHIFVRKSPEEFKKIVDGQNYNVFTGVNLNREYFEDDTGKEISLHEIMGIAHGENMVIFDAENITRIGATSINAKETWTIEKANTIFNFIQIVRLIWNSSWAKKRISITTHFNNNKQTNITCDFPVVESMCAVLTLFRQLYADNDSLMKSACEIYLQHSSNTTKASWISHCLKMFEQCLDTATEPIWLQEYTVQELLQIFLYATGIIHSPNEKNRKKRDKLSALVRLYGREKVIMAVSSSFWMLFKYAVDIFHVVKQDYEYWTEREGCAKSDMLNIYSLLQSQDK